MNVFAHQFVPRQKPGESLACFPERDFYSLGGQLDKNLDSSYVWHGHSVG